LERQQVQEHNKRTNKVSGSNCLFLNRAHSKANEANSSHEQKCFAPQGNQSWYIVEHHRMILSRLLEKEGQHPMG
jgi:hypothetical protein